jgi:hypothetical protein
LFGEAEQPQPIDEFFAAQGVEVAHPNHGMRLSGPVRGAHRKRE